MWQPYESELSHLPTFCVVGRDLWKVVMPLLCFCIVKTHHLDRVLCQFGLVQKEPAHVDRLAREGGKNLEGGARSVCP